MIEFIPLFKSNLLWEVKKRIIVLTAVVNFNTMVLQLRVIVLQGHTFVV